jgi:NNP family nitrate/nitrite transporter-like MFS transporter
MTQEIMGTKATKIRLFEFKTPAMRAFHVTWVAFFLCFFGWFGVAPLMPVIRKELALTQEQIGNLLIASVAATVLARLGIGVLCDRFGPRCVYAGLLAVGALPVMGIGLADDYVTFLGFRLAISMIGASFVITQYHTSAMFAPNVVGTANATTAGWGNLGGGVTQIVMPLVFAGLVGAGLTEAASWRVAMIVPGALMLLAAVAYLTLTQDGPHGNGPVPGGSGKGKGGFGAAVRDPRVWVVALAYGACFGVELTVHNIAAMYFHDQFALDLKTAGLVAGSFGVLALFARSLGGYLGDIAGRKLALRGRSLLLAALLLGEGLTLALFSQMGNLAIAVAVLLVFGLFTHGAAGATYSVVPFLRPKTVGAVAGIVGAGGNVGAVAAGMLFRSEDLKAPAALAILGAAVTLSGLLVLAVQLLAAREPDAALTPAPAPAE